MSRVTELIQARGSEVYKRYAAAVDAGDLAIAALCLDELRALTAIHGTSPKTTRCALERELAAFDVRHPWLRFLLAPPAELRELDPQETPGPPGSALRALEDDTQSDDREERWI